MANPSPTAHNPAAGTTATAGRQAGRTTILSFRASPAVIHALDVIQTNLKVNRTIALELCVLRTGAWLLTEIDDGESTGDNA